MKLIGHSGCDLELFQDGNNKYVRKYSKNLNYNNRLLSQIAKQEDYSSKTFFKPNILKKNYDLDGRLYFDMEFIPGISFRDYIGRIPLNKIEDYANIFLNIIPPRNDFVDVKPEIENKLNDINRNLYYSNPIIGKAFNFLYGLDWDYVSLSKCHGDLTLENIIIYNDKIYFIDFLDSFIDSWQIDFAKLFQDLETYWSYRKIKIIDENLRIRIYILKSLILRKIASLENGTNYIRNIYQLLLINLLRIYPYTSDRETLKWLDCRISQVIKLVENKKWEKYL